MQIAIPAKVEFIIEELNSRGYQAYAVGGCVRDSLLGRIPEDWDITTSARPEEVKQIFRTTIDTGIQHGTVTVLLDRDAYEVTTYRADGDYEDNRHPKKVEFITNLEEDLKRRDFTINAMAYHMSEGLVDLFGGYQDLQDKVIRCVGDAEERFGEDALRMLRAVRFSAQLGFCMEERTKEAVRTQCENLNKVSSERIQKEINKLLLSKEPGKLVDAYELGITTVVFPEFNQLMEWEKRYRKNKDEKPGAHVFRAIREVGPEKETADTDFKKDRQILKWTVLLHAIGRAVYIEELESGSEGLQYDSDTESRAQLSGSVLRRMRFDNETIRKVSHLVQYYDFPFGNTKAEVRRSIYKIGAEYLPMLFEVKRAEVLARGTGYFEDSLEELDQIRNMCAVIMKSGECVSLKQMAVTGTDLIEIGVEPGRELGRILEVLLQIVLTDPEANEKEGLLAHARLLMRK